MKNVFVATAVMVSFLSGCASVPMESPEKTATAKQFDAPSEGASGVYVFRKDTIVGSALKKDVWIDDECLGQTAKGIFFYKEVEGGEEHTVSTESEFSPNDLLIKMDQGELYFVEQYIKMGVFVGGAGLKMYNSEKGKEEVSNLNLAQQGSCST
jgi:uncharacterized protein YceK